MTIRWESAYINQLQMAYTLNASAANPDFVDIAIVNADGDYYPWKIPTDIKSGDYAIRAYDTTKDSRSDMSDNTFKIQ